MNPINSLAFDLHSIKLADPNSDTSVLSNSNTPTMNNTAPLQRTVSLVDSIGIQRASSPFVPADNNVIDGAATVSINAYGPEITGSNPQIPINQEGSNAFNAASNLHMSANSPSIINSQSKVLPNMSSCLFHPTGLAPNVNNQPPPPGIESQWKYIDSNGNVQGPFGTNNMSQWYQGGYFTPTLQICRLATSVEPFGVNDRFVTLGELTTLVNNYQDPFATFDFIVITALNGALPIVSNVSKDQKVETRNLKPAANVHSDDFTYEEILGLKYEDGSYYRETQVWVPVNGRHIMKVEHIPENFRKPAPATELATRLEQKAVQGEENFQDKREAPPEACKILPNKMSGEEHIVNTSTEENQEVRHAEEKNIPSDQVQPKDEEPDVKDRMSDIKEPESYDATQISFEEQKRFAKSELMAQKLLEEQRRQEEEKKSREEQRKLKKEKKLRQKQKKEEDKLMKKKKEEGKLEKEKHKELLNSILDGQMVASPTESPVTSSSTNLAPWANKQSDNVIYNQIPSALEDLKKNNSFKKEKKPSRTQLDREEALKLQKEILGSTQTQPTARTGSVWGIKPHQPVKLDIKEELMKSSNNRNDQPAISKLKMAKNGDTKSDSTFIEEQKKLWEQVQKKSKKSNRINPLDDFVSGTPSPSSSASNFSKGSNAWTTVSSKNTTNTTVAPVSLNQSRSFVSPGRLRSSGATTTMTKTKAGGKSKQIGSSTSIPTLKARQVKASRVPAYPGNASVSKRQEFLKWCRSQLKLNSSAQPDNVLEMLLSLPPGSESKEIIADTIYSYSSTMDGRRFAADFINKRLKCEEQISDPLSWSEVLTMPEGSSEDWEFQIVGKKKGKRF
ncbi:hypothetical protein SKDZ_16G1690 [Saccharomyces kudriavzevii ZP591]|nr:hypothetical protein SKDZ_16G1690 [Saccharomyces kudriavzevii ZP591]